MPHTADLTPADLTAIRALLDRAYDGDFTDTDWANALGGVHVLVHDGPHLVAHAAVVARRLLHAGHVLRTGYVEAVAVHPGHRGRGHAAAVMAEAERLIRGGYDLGGLSAAEGVDGFYRNRGWQAWRGPTGVLSPSGIVRTPDDDDSTYVLATPATPPLDDTGLLVCDWRSGDVW